MDHGSVAIMLISCVLVFIMIGGTPFFYGGLVRARGVLNMITMVLSALPVTVMTWLILGWSIARGDNDLGGIIGNPIKGFLFNDAILRKNGLYVSAQSATSFYPRVYDLIFFVLVGVLTVALIAGSLAERTKVGSWMVFVTVWIILVFAPLVHMLWTPGGLLSSNGAISTLLGAHVIDVGGGSLIGLATAMSALMILLFSGRRTLIARRFIKPHNLPLSLVGGTLFLFGGFGLAVGAAFRDGASTGYAVICVLLGACAGGLTWLIVERITTKRFTPLGLMSGMFAGFISSLPGIDVLAPLWIVIIAIFASLAAYYGEKLKYVLGYDDSLDVIAINGFSALIGVIGVGLFAQGSGLFVGGGIRLLGAQFLSLLIVLCWSGIITGLVAFIIEHTMGWRVSQDEESSGIDISDQGGSAYDFDDSLGSVVITGQK